MKANIAFDAKRLFANTSGLGNYSRTLVSNLARYVPQHQLYLYTPSRSTEIVTTQLEAQPNVHLRHHTAPFGAYWRARGVLSDLRQDNIDLYHGLSHEIPIGIAQTTIKSVVTIHDLIYKLRPELFPWFDRQVYDFKFGYSIQHADQIIAITESTRTDILTHFPATDPARISVVYQTCDSLYFEQPRCEVDVAAKYNLPTRYLLNVGSIVARKNVEVVLRALAQLAPEQRLPLVVVGRGQAYKEHLVQLARANGISELLHIIENLTDTRELIEVYRGAEALVYPSVYEGFGIPLLEAQLCGTPVIASSMAALQEAGGKHAYYIDAQDVAGFAKALRKVSELTTTERQTLTQSARKEARRRFAPEVLTRKLHEVYAEVLGASAR